MALASVAEALGALSHIPKGCGFDSGPGHIPRFWIRSPVRAHPRRQPIDVSLSHQCFSLFSSSAFKNSEKMFPGED